MLATEPTGNKLTTDTAPARAMTNSMDWLKHPDRFVQRHIGPDPADIEEMLAVLGHQSLDELVDAAVPANIRLAKPLNLPAGRSEFGVLNELRAIAVQNQVFRSYVGLGYHDCITPPVIQRNVLENPGWYTAYTPYQAEIAQGRLEALLNFQTMVIDLTALEIANASLLDEATAAAEAMTMSYALKGKPGKEVFLVASECHPQTIDVVKTRASVRGIEVRVASYADFKIGPDVFGALVQYPATDGAVIDYTKTVEHVHKGDALLTVAADLLSLVLLTPPGEWGADIVVGNSQRFGVPLGYGGPHAAYFATKDEFKRHLPGRIIGVSRDADGKPALRMALQTREQHIRREKATSNVCTAQVLLAVVASMYAVYHGPQGLTRIARRVHGFATALAEGLRRLGYSIVHEDYFDTVRVALGKRSPQPILDEAQSRRINLRPMEDRSIVIALDETVTNEDMANLFASFNGGKEPEFSLEDVVSGADFRYDERFNRTTPFLTHHVVRLRQDPSFRATRSDRRVSAPLRRAGARTRGDHGICRRVVAAERGIARRIRGTAGDSRIPRIPEPGREERLPHPAICAWNESGERGDGGNEGRSGEDGCTRQHRRGRSSRQGGGACERPGSADGHLSVNARRVRGIDSRDLRHRPQVRRASLYGWGEHERDGRAVPARGHRRRCMPPESPQDVLHSPRRRRPGNGSDRSGEASRFVLARPSGGRAQCPPRRRSGLGGTVGKRQHSSDLLRLHQTHGR